MTEENISQNLPCWICENPAVGVVCSPLGAISGPYCIECLKAGRQPWNVLVGSLIGVTASTIHPGLRPLIDATLEFYKKSEKDLWDDVQKFGDELDNL